MPIPCLPIIGRLHGWVRETLKGEDALDKASRTPLFLTSNLCESEKRQNNHDNHNDPDDVDNVVHEIHLST
jgi:hypothetical protein